jgi:hypothetical protein
MVETIIFCSLIETIRPEELEIAWVVFREEEETRMQEWLAIHSYAGKYGELPPLNLLAARKRFAIVGLGELDKNRIASSVSEELKSLVDP